MKNVFTLTALLLIGGTASAQTPQNCAPREAIVEKLQAEYRESQQSVGLGDNNSMLEVFANTEAGSWSILVTSPNGFSCLVASGQSYSNLYESLPPNL